MKAVDYMISSWMWCSALARTMQPNWSTMSTSSCCEGGRQKRCWKNCRIDSVVLAIPARCGPKTRGEKSVPRVKPIRWKVIRLRTSGGRQLLLRTVNFAWNWNCMPDHIYFSSQNNYSFLAKTFTKVLLWKYIARNKQRIYIISNKINISTSHH